MRDLFRNEHAVILYYINVFMSPFTLSLHLFFDRPLFRAVDCHYKTRQTAARQTDTRHTGKTRQTVARQTGIASKWDAPNWTASNRHASKRTRQTGLTATSTLPARNGRRLIPSDLVLFWLISWTRIESKTKSVPTFIQILVILKRWSLDIL